MASDDPIITEKMLEEEKLLAVKRAQDEAAEVEALSKATPDMDETNFSKLDQLLNQTKIYSQFLLERMDDIAMVGLSTPLVLSNCVRGFGQRGASVLRLERSYMTGVINLDLDPTYIADSW